MSGKPHILLFDLYSDGHHRMYLELLATRWIELRLQGKLELLVSTRFEEKHPQFCKWVRSNDKYCLRLSTVTADRLSTESNSLSGLIQNDVLHSRILKEHTRTNRPDHIVLMYFDHCQVSLLFNLFQRINCSGIYFRPSFHYENMGGLNKGLTNLRKIFLLRGALRNPWFRNLFCLDPFVVPLINRNHKRSPAVWLPDGFSDMPPSRSAEDYRDSIGVETGRSLLLFFGVVSRRKGIFELFNAVSNMNAATQRSVTLLLAGRYSKTDAEEIEGRISRLECETEVQIIASNTFIDDSDIGNLFYAADLVLVPYHHHVGSSNVLVRAAKAGTPVVGSDFGLVGKMIRHYSLGIAVDTLNTNSLCAAIEKMIGGGSDESFNQETASEFASINSAEKFADTIFAKLGVLP